MLEGLFGNITVEKILFSLFVYGEVYALGLAKDFDQPVNRFQQQLKRLKGAGIIVSRCAGKTRLYSTNPRYPFRKELVALVAKAFEFVPDDEKLARYRKRTRPRRAGKPS